MTATSGQGAAPQMTFTVPPLPYAFDALEPYIDAKTMEIHHDKHHGAYVTNLNKALEGHADLQKLSVEELLAQINKVPENIRPAGLAAVEQPGHVKRISIRKPMISAGRRETLIRDVLCNE